MSIMHHQQGPRRQHRHNASLDGLPLPPWMVCKQPGARQRRALRTGSETPERCTDTASSPNARGKREPAAPIWLRALGAHPTLARRALPRCADSWLLADLEGRYLNLCFKCGGLRAQHAQLLVDSIPPSIGIFNLDRDESVELLICLLNHVS